MKKFLSLVLALIMLASVFPVSALAEDEPETPESPIGDGGTDNPEDDYKGFTLVTGNTTATYQFSTDASAQNYTGGKIQWNTNAEDITWYFTPDSGKEFRGLLIATPEYRAFLSVEDEGPIDENEGTYSMIIDGSYEEFCGMDVTVYAVTDESLVYVKYEDSVEYYDKYDASVLFNGEKLLTNPEEENSGVPYIFSGTQSFKLNFDMSSIGVAYDYEKEPEVRFTTFGNPVVTKPAVADDGSFSMSFEAGKDYELTVSWSKVDRLMENAPNNTFPVIVVYGFPGEATAAYASQSAEFKNAYAAGYTESFEAGVGFNYEKKFNSNLVKLPDQCGFVLLLPNAVAGKELSMTGTATKPGYILDYVVDTESGTYMNVGEGGAVQVTLPETIAEQTKMVLYFAFNKPCVRAIFNEDNFQVWYEEGGEPVYLQSNGNGDPSKNTVFAGHTSVTDWTFYIKDKSEDNRFSGIQVMSTNSDTRFISKKSLNNIETGVYSYTITDTNKVYLIIFKDDGGVYENEFAVNFDAYDEWNEEQEKDLPTIVGSARIGSEEPFAVNDGAVNAYVKDSPITVTFPVPEDVEGIYRVDILRNGTDIPVRFNGEITTTTDENVKYASFSYTPDYNSGFEIDVYWTEAQYNYSRLVPENDKEFIIQYNAWGNGSVSFETEDAITYAEYRDNRKAKITVSAEGEKPEVSLKLTPKATDILENLFLDINGNSNDFSPEQLSFGNGSYTYKLDFSNANWIYFNAGFSGNTDPAWKFDSHDVDELYLVDGSTETPVNTNTDYSYTDGETLRFKLINNNENTGGCRIEYNGQSFYVPVAGGKVGETYTWTFDFTIPEGSNNNGYSFFFDLNTDGSWPYTGKYAFFYADGGWSDEGPNRWVKHEATEGGEKVTNLDYPNTKYDYSADDTMNFTLSDVPYAIELTTNDGIKQLWKPDVSSYPAGFNFNRFDKALTYEPTSDMGFVFRIYWAENEWHLDHMGTSKDNFMVVARVEGEGVEFRGYACAEGLVADQGSANNETRYVVNKNYEGSKELVYYVKPESGSSISRVVYENGEDRELTAGEYSYDSTNNLLTIKFDSLENDPGEGCWYNLRIEVEKDPGMVIRFDREKVSRVVLKQNDTQLAELHFDSYISQWVASNGIESLTVYDSMIEWTVLCSGDVKLVAYASENCSVNGVKFYGNPCTTRGADAEDDTGKSVELNVGDRLWLDLITWDVDLYSGDFMVEEYDGNSEIYVQTATELKTINTNQAYWFGDYAQDVQDNKPETGTVTYKIKPEEGNTAAPVIMIEYQETGITFYPGDFAVTKSGDYWTFSVKMPTFGMGSDTWKVLDGVRIKIWWDRDRYEYDRYWYNNDGYRMLLYCWNDQAPVNAVSYTGDTHNHTGSRTYKTEGKASILGDTTTYTFEVKVKVGQTQPDLYLKCEGQEDEKLVIGTHYTVSLDTENQYLYTVNDSVGIGANFRFDYSEAKPPVTIEGTDQVFNTLEAALSSTTSGQTVKVLEDISEPNLYAIVQPGVILDLNGKEVTLKALIVFGAVKDSSEVTGTGHHAGAGKLVMNNTSLAYMASVSTNTASTIQIPAYVDGGFVFHTVSDIPGKWTTNLDSTGKAIYKFRPLLSDNNQKAPNFDWETVLQNGSGVKLRVYVEIEMADGIQKYDFEYSKAVTDAWISKFVEGKTPGTFALSINMGNTTLSAKARPYVYSEYANLSLLGAEATTVAP